MDSAMHRRLAILILWGFVAMPTAFGQAAGSRGGMESQTAKATSPPLLERDIAETYIAIDGRAEVRVQPTEIRMVLAIISEGETAQECQNQITKTTTHLKEAWANLGIAQDNIVTDFIAVLPRYQWSLKKQEGADVGIEERNGYRMQTNIHLAVKNESEAQTAMARAFEQGVTDIIAFDYWSRELDAIQVEARKQALDAARKKADTLLGALFDNPPPMINVQEQTNVHYPESLYHSFSNSLEQSVTPAWRGNIPFIHAYRPLNTYYRGLFVDTDIRSQELPMNPEISVISTVRLYFESPAAKRAKQESKD
ncbi:MAG: SIMPL domain-containing protein [Pirellulales bacterium]|nr:SIMPL domain-containing protein [Pirellulales bacterium]